MPRRKLKNFLGHYRLMGKLAVPEPDIIKWAMWFETANRHVARTKIGSVVVSTVFLGLDHNFLRRGLPVLFETMVFRRGKGDDTFRCETWEQAEKMHKDAVAQVRAEIKKKVNQ